MKFVEHMVPNSISFEIEIEEILEDFNSPYQRMRILQSKDLGKLLVLDDEIQFAELDEFVYHEMFCFPSLLSHNNPQSVLIIGGGDLLLAKQVLKFPNIKRIEVVDLDSKVVDICKKRFNNLLTGVIDNPKLNVIIQDGFEFVSNTKRKYDVIYIDLTMVKDICEPLHTDKFYENVKKILNTNGLIAAQSDYGGYFYYSWQSNTLRPINSLLNMKNSIIFLRLFKTQFKFVHQYSQHVPSFFGDWSFTIGSDYLNFKDVKLEDIKSRFNLLEGEDPLIYSPQYHQAIKFHPRILQRLYSKLGSD